MEIFVLIEEVARLELALLTSQGELRLQQLIELAWHLRQRDTHRALVLADQAMDLLPASAKEGGCIGLARLQLIWAETKWLRGDLAQAQMIAQQAWDIFTRHACPEGVSDVHWLMASIELDRGNMERLREELLLVAEAGRLAQDSLRVNMALVCQARLDALNDFNLAQERWGNRFDPDQAGQHPALLSFIAEFVSFVAVQRGDYAYAIAHFIRAQDLALQTGQIRLAMSTMTNIGNSFSNLNDHHTALEWMQRGLDLARAGAWVPRIGIALMQTGETLRLLGQLDAAQEMLDEALNKMAPLAGSRSYAICLNYLADLQLDQGRYADALDTFRLLQQRANALGQLDFQIDSLRGQAHALSFLGKADAALQAANEALAMAKAHHDAILQMAAFRVLIDIHRRFPLLGMDSTKSTISVASRTLHYLLQAMQVASSIEGYIMPGDLLDALAREYAQAGDYEQAYAISLRAISARETTHSQDATNRAIAMQVRHQTENAQAEGEYHQQLAASEARRAEVLQRTTITLERLSAIGREITAHLEAQAVFEALNRHVHGLLNASALAIYLALPDQITLRGAFAVEQGVIISVPDIRLDDPSAYSARCARERNEIVLNFPKDELLHNLVPGTLHCPSKLYAPLLLGERLLGVMTIQSSQVNAYAERERLIFRTLCAYGAIALDNAQAYQQLQQAQTQLVAREKLAALGSLVAGVAHELNTPIGNCLMLADVLQRQTMDVDQKMNQKNLSLSDLRTFLDDTRDMSVLILRGLSSAADLVNSFKQVAVDRTTAQRRVFDLQQTSHEVIATMMNRIRRGGHTIQLHIPEGVSMNSYPGPFGQVLGNFVNNALLHAFDGRSDGHMSVTAQTDGSGRVRIQFCDNGVGISEANLQRIFDPFFTTKIGQGGSGLGLSISFNIVTSLLNGQLTASSKLGQGTVFTLDLPLTAPIVER